jgi:DNA helicase-2/ATP-dependent DNA helicase PcrA
VHDDILAGLNAAQREAVTTIDGPVLVLAGPGSGKTRVLAHRVAYLLRVVQVHPRAIMAVTFTNKAAQEMRDRINGLLGESVPASTGWRGLTLGTFHSICARILRQEAELAGLRPDYVIYDDGDQLTAIKQTLRELNISEKQYRPEAMRAAISRMKNELVRPSEMSVDTYWAQVLTRVYEYYEKLMAANGAVDFDDLLARTVYLFREHPQVLARYQERYRYLLVDEFQDTNTAQYELMRLLAAQHHNLFAVGDEDQSIYGFRGADYRNVLRFREDFPTARVILLEQNYRSTQTILDAANAIISRNRHRTPKALRTNRGRGPAVTIYEAYDEMDEATYVVRTIRELMARGQARPKDCAVMYRTNAQSRPLEDAFVMWGMPYRLVGGTRFYQRREIKDMLAYLRLIHNPADNFSFSRIINVPRRGIGEKTLATLAQWSSAHGVGMAGGLALIAGDLYSPALPEEVRTRYTQPPEHPFSPAVCRTLMEFYRLLAGWLADRHKLTVVELLDRIADESGYAVELRDGTPEGEDRWANVQELRSVAAYYNDFPPELRLSAFLEEVALVSDQDELNGEDDRVTLLTLHTAKGLEFPVVFIVGLEENILPHVRSMDDPDQLEEERRLMYVGVTRAKDRLYLVRAFRRTLFGRNELNEPSRFLRDVAQARVTTAEVLSSGEAELVTASPQAREGRQERSVGESHRPRGLATPHRTSPAHGAVEPPSRPAAAIAGREGGPAREGRGPQFSPGDRVDHGLFGEGIVLKSELTADDEEVTIAFADKGIKTLLASYAKLRKIGQEATPRGL